jgi:RNA recognition motif-containing protein
LSPTERKEVAMTTLFIGNLSPEVTDGDLRHVFEEYGRVTSVRLVSRKRLAYVELDPEAAESAVAGLTGTQLKGRTLDVVIDDSGGGGKPRRRKGRR